MQFETQAKIISNIEPIIKLSVRSKPKHNPDSQMKSLPATYFFI